MILGLDISTSIVGVCIMEDNKILHSDYIDLRKIKNFLQKAVTVENYLENLDFKIEPIFIEEAFTFFRGGGSTAKRMSLLQKFNGVVSWICYKNTGLEPVYISPISARSKCGIKVPRGRKAKDVVMEYFIKSQEIQIDYTRYNNVQQYCYDVADAVIIAKAGTKIILDR